MLFICFPCVLVAVRLLDFRSTGLHRILQAELTFQDSKARTRGSRSSDRRRNTGSASVFTCFHHVFVEHGCLEEVQVHPRPRLRREETASDIELSGLCALSMGLSSSIKRLLKHQQARLAVELILSSLDSEREVAAPASTDEERLFAKG